MPCSFTISMLLTLSNAVFTPQKCTNVYVAWARNEFCSFKDPEVLVFFFFYIVTKFVFTDKTMSIFIKLNLFSLKDWTLCWVYSLPTFWCCDKILFLLWNGHHVVSNGIPKCWNYTNTRSSKNIIMNRMTAALEENHYL